MAGDATPTILENAFEDTEHDDLRLSNAGVKEISLRSSQRVSAKYLTSNLTTNPNDISRLMSTPRAGLDQDESVEYFLKTSNPNLTHPPAQKTDPVSPPDMPHSKISAQNPTK